MYFIQEEVENQSQIPNIKYQIQISPTKDQISHPGFNKKTKEMEVKQDKIQNPSSKRESIMHKCTKNKIKNETDLQNERITYRCSEYKIKKQNPFPKRYKV
jgi:hypothetical protein